MKLIRADLTYITKLYFHSTKVILPSIIWLLSVLLNYQVQPNYIIASFLTTATVMFIVAMITTYGFFENLTTLQEKLLLLDNRNQNSIYLAFFIFIYLVLALGSTLAIIIPMIKYLYIGKNFFIGQLTGIDIISGWLVQLIGIPLGIAIGFWTQKRVIKHRKTALLLTALIAIIAIQSGSMFGQTSWLNYVFPPIYPVFLMLGKSNQFHLASVLLAFIIVYGYALLLLLLNFYYLNRCKFDR